MDKTYEIANCEAPLRNWIACGGDDDLVPVIHAELRPLDDGARVQILRELRCGDTVLAGGVVWSKELPHVDAAEIFDVLEGLGGDLSLICEAAVLLPHSQVDAILETFIVKARVEREEEANEAAEAAAEAEKKARKSRECVIYFTGEKAHSALEIRKGGKAFFKLKFNAEWERARFHDWLKWQSARFEAFEALVQADGVEQLRGALLKEMLVTEQAVKKRGLGAGGRRPLIFWRGEQ